MKSVWVAIGGIIGLVAIIGLIVAVAQLWQAWQASVAQDSTQATMIALLDIQVKVNQEIATVQASDVESAPTATALAERIEQLTIAQETLEAERSQLEIRLTSVPSPAPQAPPPQQQNIVRDNFRFKVDGIEATEGELRVTAGEHIIEIGAVSNFYSNPYLMFDASSVVGGWNFFQTKVTDNENAIIVCLPVDGVIKMGNGTEGVGANLREDLSCSANPQPVLVPTIGSQEVFRFKIDGKIDNAGELPVTAGEHVIEIGLTTNFYTNPYLMFDASSPVDGWNFFQTKVTDNENAIIVCLPVDGVIKMGNGTEGVGANLREDLSCP